MKKRMLLICFLFILPCIVNASTENDKVVSSTVKYYKTVEKLISNQANSTNSIPTSSYTIEITKEEYNNAPVDSFIAKPNSVGVETTYKKMTTEIVTNGNNYKYRVTLEWKNMPSVRSYDIIGIGYYSDVTNSNTPSLIQDYCYTNGSCSSSSTYTVYTSTTGSGASFALPTSTSLKSLKQTFWVNVKKRYSGTIIDQIAAGDYSHATKKISQENAKKYTVDLGGIELNSSISSYYDSIQAAVAEWEGTW